MTLMISSFTWNAVADLVSLHAPWQYYYFINLTMYNRASFMCICAYVRKIQFRLYHGNVWMEYFLGFAFINKNLR